jgi:DnaJ-class molecular chaperone
MQGLAKDAGPHMDPSEVFAQFFETGFSFDFGPGSGFGQGRGKKQDVITQEVTLEDLYNGKSIKMDLQREVVCAQCKGYPQRSSQCFPVLTQLLHLGREHEEMPNLSHAQHAMERDGHLLRHK